MVYPFYLDWVTLDLRGLMDTMLMVFMTEKNWRESAPFRRKEKVQFIPMEYTENLLAANASSKGGVEILHCIT